MDVQGPQRDEQECEQPRSPKGRAGAPHLRQLQHGVVPGLGADGALLPGRALRPARVQHRAAALHPEVALRIAAAACMDSPGTPSGARSYLCTPDACMQGNNTPPRDAEPSGAGRGEDGGLACTAAGAACVGGRGGERVGLQVDAEHAGAGVGAHAQLAALRRKEPAGAASVSQHALACFFAITARTQEKAVRECMAGIGCPPVTRQAVIASGGQHSRRQVPRAAALSASEAWMHTAQDVGRLPSSSPCR